ncbi:hypothetical protein SVIOM342S_09573 [Streptomyces violaceorubidus]
MIATASVALDASTGNRLHTFCDRAPCSNVLFTHVPRDTATGRGRRTVDPVIITGAGPVGLTLALALARQEVPCVVLDEARARTNHAPRAPSSARGRSRWFERLTGAPLTGLGSRWAGWRSMRRKQVTREVVFGDAEPAPCTSPSTS